MMKRQTRQINKLLVAFSCIIFCLSSNLYAAKQGDMASDFTLKLFGDEGKEIKLSDYKGKVVYLDFWASWCAPCRVSFPFYNELQDEYNKDELVIIAISEDVSTTEALKFLERVPAKFMTGWDKDNQIAAAYEPLGMPTSYLIDKDGTIKSVMNGFKKSKMPIIRKRINALLSK